MHLPLVSCIYLFFNLHVECCTYENVLCNPLIAYFCAYLVSFLLTPFLPGIQSFPICDWEEGKWQTHISNFFCFLYEVKRSKSAVMYGESQLLLIAAMILPSGLFGSKHEVSGRQKEAGTAFSWAGSCSSHSSPDHRFNRNKHGLHWGSSLLLLWLLVRNGKDQRAQWREPTL